MSKFIQLNKFDKDDVKFPESKIFEYGENEWAATLCFDLPRADHVVDVLMVALEVNWDQELNHHVLSEELIGKLIDAIKLEMPQWTEAEKYKANLLLSELEDQLVSFDFEDDYLLTINWSTD